MKITTFFLHMIIYLPAFSNIGSLAVDEQFSVNGDRKIQRRGNMGSLRQSMSKSLAALSYPISFLLYSRANPDNPESIKPENASASVNFKPELETKVVIHGHMQSASDTEYIQIKNAYLLQDNYNVILVDWIHAKIYSYTTSSTITQDVGAETARLLQNLNGRMEKVHIIGYGLGAHCGGVAGTELNSRVGRITGLDASLPLFRMADDYFKLDKNDAEFVDIIHTDSGDNLWFANHLGMGEAIGTVDFYPNKGIFQPGCPEFIFPTFEDLQCSHIRALEIFIESIGNKERFIACKCHSWTAFQESKCECLDENNLAYVGEHTSTNVYGNYYFVTYDKSPYGMGKRGSSGSSEYRKKLETSSRGNENSIRSRLPKTNALENLYTTTKNSQKSTVLALGNRSARPRGLNKNLVTPSPATATSTINDLTKDFEVILPTSKTEIKTIRPNISAATSTNWDLDSLSEYIIMF